MAARMIVEFDVFSYQCPYFTNDGPDGCSYGCTHPDTDDLDENTETGKLVGRCLCPGCPICCSIEEEDLDDPNLDWDGLERSDFCDIDGNFIMDGEYATICCDDTASPEEKAGLYAYQRYMHRYDKRWLENHKEVM